jgi:subtilase family serine protease
MTPAHRGAGRPREVTVPKLHALGLKGPAAILTALAATLVWAGPAHADAPSGTTANLLPGLSQATDLGPVASSTPLDLVVTLARPDAAGERAYIAATADPGSPQYRHFLTPAQFAQRFGVPDAEVAKVRDFLSAGGLTVGHVSTAGDQLSVRGSAADVEALFRTAVHSFSAQGKRFVANLSAPSFPSDLPIANIVGLETLTSFTVPHHAGGQQSTCLPLGVTCTDTCLPAVGCTGGTTPADLAGVYQRPASARGAGQGLAVLGEGQSDDVIADLRAFEQHFGLSQVPVTVKHPAGDTDFSDDSGRPEWDIDTQASSALADQASGLTLYFGTDLSDADVARVFSTFTDDADGPMQASASYGECESLPGVSSLVSTTIAQTPLGDYVGLGNDMDATLDQITRQAAAEGKTIFASTGDNGSSCPVVALPGIGSANGLLNEGVPVTNSPASLPYVTAVGGTVLYTDGHGHRVREYGWTHSGGGDTLVTPAPDYQQGVSGLSLPCVTDPGVTCRGIADVAAQSGDALGNGFDIVMDGTYTDAGGSGTSLSAPLLQGLWADVQSAAPTSGGWGFANESLYRAGKADQSASFFDVSSFDPTTGVPSSNGLYPTLPGWDYVTGWGTPKVDGLIGFLQQQ